MLRKRLSKREPNPWAKACQLGAGAVEPLTTS